MVIRRGFLCLLLCIAIIGNSKFYMESFTSAFWAQYEDHVLVRAMRGFFLNEEFLFSNSWSFCTIVPVSCHDE